VTVNEFEDETWPSLHSMNFKATTSIIMTRM